MNDHFVYRMAEDKDIPQIVTLFELCLGSDGGAPTVAFWNWKHHQNPAGNSPVILAWDGDLLIGIRAFMCFKFHDKKGVFKAYRPVDTATHPDYQGKGIFKKLTLQLIEDLQSINEKAFIFNTPNSQSKPGYLKMGWIEWGKPLIQLFPSLAIFPVSFKKDQAVLLDWDFSNITTVAGNQLEIYKDSDYYKWRYQQIALQGYGIKTIKYANSQYDIIYRKKRLSFINEFRVCDVIKNNVSCNQIPLMVLLKLACSFRMGLVSFISAKRFWLTLKPIKKAPMITFRKIKDEDVSISFNKIHWNTGELELF